MTTSLPKPLQNDFDTIVIDLLSRYSLDNKSVQKFVQIVAQQVRDIRRLPRTLQPSKNSTNSARTNTPDNKETKDGTDKPNFLTRLQNVQNTFNKGGLLGVFFEYLKNKQADAKAKITPAEPLKFKQDEDTKDENGSEVRTTEQKNAVTGEIITRLDKLQESVITQLDKLQEAFDSKGLINIAQSILTTLKKNPKKESEKENVKYTKEQEDTAIPISTAANKIVEDSELPSAISNTFTTVPQNTNFSTVNATDTQTNKTNTFTTVPQNTNFSTVNATNAQTVAPNTTNLSQINTSQAQAEDYLPDEIDVIVGGINDYGKRDLREVLSSVIEDLIPKEKQSVPAKDKKEATESGEGGGLIGLLANLSQMGGVVGRLLPMLGSFASTLGSVAAIAGTVVAGDIIGGQIGKAIGSNEKFSEFFYGSPTAGKEAYEKYGTGIEGFANASYDLLFGQGAELRQEAKESKVREEKLKIDHAKNSREKIQKTIATKSPEEVKKLQEKTQNNIQETQEKVKQLQEEYEKVKDPMEGWNPFRSKEKDQAEFDAKQRLENAQQQVEQLQSALTEFNKTGTVTPSTTDTQPPTQESQITSENTTPTAVAPIPEVADAMFNPEGGLLVSSPKEGSLFQLSKNDGLVAGPLTSVTPETTKVSSSIPSSVSETHITNNNADEKTLYEIANNTKETNKSLNTLSNAVFQLAKVFDNKTMSGGSNSVLINNNGKVQEYTSTAQIAANNVDSIRSIRQQFLAVT